MQGGIRKSLHDAVIRDGHRMHAKGDGCIDVFFNIRNAIHIRKLRMKMKLYPLLRA